MEIKFNREEIDAMLIKNVIAMGIKVNVVRYESGYNSPRAVTLSWEEPLVDMEAEPVEAIVTAAEAIEQPL